MQQVIIDNFVIDIIRKRIKNTYLRIHGVTGKISVTAPMRLSEKTLYEFIQERIDWLKKHVAACQPSIETTARYLTGEVHYFQGKAYTLNIIETKTRGVIQIRDDTFDFYVPFNADTKKRARILERWYRARLFEITAPLLIKWQTIIQVKINEFNVKNMKTKWGTCNTRYKRIWLSLALAKKPLECIEYVVVHELVHLLEKSHNHVFKAYMDQFYPNWRTVRKALNHKL